MQAAATGELHQEMENLLEEENGIMARNFIIFEESSKLNQESNFTIGTAMDWDAVEPLVETVGWDFIFGLNILLHVN